MRGNRVVVGVFAYLDDLIRAIKTTRESRLEYTVYSPFPHHELEELEMPARSPVRIVTLVGAVSGLLFGYGLTIFCSLDWPLRVSAKPVVSVPAFTVIGYECTILFGAIFTLVALLVSSRLPHLVRSIGYDRRFSADRFGLAVGCNSEDAADVRERLLAAGAEEAEVREAL